MGDQFEKMFGPIVGKGLQATVYAGGEYAVKLYRAGYPKTYVFEEACIMARLEEMRFPGPKVYEVLLAEGQYGLRMERVRGKPVAEGLRDPARQQETMETLVDLQLGLQKQDAPWAPNLKQRMRQTLAPNDKVPADIRKKLLEQLEKLPDGQSLCHCDFHGDNVFYDGEKHTIIDLLQVSAGDPAADAVCSYVSYSIAGPEIAKVYLDTYCEKSGVSRERIRQWLPVYAGAILGQVPDEYAPLLEGFIAGGGAL